MIKCQTGDIPGHKCWYFDWSMRMLRVDSDKIVRHRNTLELYVDFSLVICELSLSNLLFLIHTYNNSGKFTVG